MISATLSSGIELWFGVCNIWRLSIFGIASFFTICRHSYILRYTLFIRHSFKEADLACKFISVTDLKVIGKSKSLEFLKDKEMPFMNKLNNSRR